MEADRIRAIRAKAIYKATQKGCTPENAEDFAQEACLHIFKGRKATVSQLLVDYFRDTQGATRYGKQHTKELRLFDEQETIDELPVSGIVGTEPDLLNYLNLLTGEDRVITALKFGWDMTEPEIGAILGISGSRVSQKFKEISVRLRKRLNNAERGSS